MHRRTLASGAPRTADARNVRALIIRYPALEPIVARMSQDRFAVAYRSLTLGAMIDATDESDMPHRHLRPLPDPPPGTRPSEAGLSPREIEVVRLIAHGLTNKGIGERLGLSDKTIKNHISHVLRKLGLRARTQVAVLALRSGMD